MSLPEDLRPVGPDAIAHSPATGRAPESGGAVSAVGPIQPPAIALPKGGGAIRGIGEKFATNPVTGTATATIPILTSPGRFGFGPQLTLSYDSGAGNGPFGFGWTLSQPAITRKTDKGLPLYRDADESDVFILDEGEDLVPVLDERGLRHSVAGALAGYTVDRYRPRIEGAFARVERWTRAGDGDVHWRSISRDNVLTVYGRGPRERIADPDDPARIFSWLISEVRDDTGNAVVYDYKAEDGTGTDAALPHQRSRGDGADRHRTANRYLTRIRYGNRLPALDDAGRRPFFLSIAQLEAADWMFEVVFDYGEHDPDAPVPEGQSAWDHRVDAFSSYRPGFEVRTARRCRRVLMFHHFPDEPEVGADCLVRSTDFRYSPSSDPDTAESGVYSFLEAATQSGYRRHGDGYLKRSLPPVEYEYTRPSVSDRVVFTDATSLENLPVGIDGAAYTWADLHGEGIPGILSEQAGEWLYKRNLSPLTDPAVTFAPQERVEVRPNLGFAGGRARFMDLLGDGRPDLVVFGGNTPGLYEHDDEEAWYPFRPFTSTLVRDERDPNLRLVDLTGDGRADVLVTEDDAFTWHASMGKEGFGSASRTYQPPADEHAPRLVFADGTGSLYLADFSGDGLPDLVRITASAVCYWPNIGYGHFGAKVTMDNAPCLDSPDQFDQKRLRLADIDGTGTTDIIYLHREGVRLYFNQSGNGWSSARKLRVFPGVDDLVSVATADLLGNGTACLVWSSPLPGDSGRQLRYVDLMGGQKPHLLVRTVNNLGAETHVRFASSTKFYLEDKQNGRPWVARLPFPVHVVTRLDVIDKIGGNRFTSRFSYHDGYFDPVEREFRGFGMVEQWDSEEFDAPASGEGEATATNLDPAFRVPPILTRTWFHTGRDSLAIPVSEYAVRLPESVMPPGLTAAEKREACRALKGLTLRHEIYGMDGSDKANIPYTVDESNYTVECAQTSGPNRHAVFFSHPRESVSMHYERTPGEPRLSHMVTLEVDQYANVLKQLAIGYGRRHPSNDAALDDAAEVQQSATLIVLTESSYSNPVLTAGDHRTPLAVETRSFELTGFKPGAHPRRYSFEDWSGHDCALTRTAEELAFEQVPNLIDRQKRLLELNRQLFRRDDLTGFLPLGTVEPLALPGESYKLALTPALLERIFTRSNADGSEDFLLPDAASVLAGRGSDQGGFVGSDFGWLAPSGRVFFDAEADPDDPASTAEREREKARRHFFQPRLFVDPFGQMTTVDFDRYQLLPIRTRDAMDNTVSAENDYRMLQARLVTDANRNRSVAAFDALGMVVATAVMGKSGENVGDRLDGFDVDQPMEDVLEFVRDPITEAAKVLGQATTRFIYDLGRYHRSGSPVLAASLARESHISAPGGTSSRVQITFTYADGFGREIQKKMRAEPGAAPERRPPVRSAAGDAGLGELVRDATGAPVLAHAQVRWVGSGRTVYNNKGKPVRRYEPFFSATHLHEPENELTDTGISPLLFYDPLGRVVATLHPNHTFEKVLFGPWRKVSYDLNDTVAPHGSSTGDPRTDPDVGGYVREYFGTQPSVWKTWFAQRIDAERGAGEREAAQKAAAHAGTPTTTHLDSLGRPMLTIGHNRHPRNGEMIDEYVATRVQLDIEGHALSVIDATGRIVMQYDYDILGNCLHHASMEAGERWTLNDVSGKPIRLFDSRRIRRRIAYDPLRRQTALFVSEDSSERLAERIEYGENLGDVANHRLRIHRKLDGAGVMTCVAYDFKGNVSESARSFLVDYRSAVNWLDNPETEGMIYASRVEFDALDRPISIESPDGSIHRPRFNEANLLERMEVESGAGRPAVPFVTNVDYDARGQRTRVEYGNGAVTTHEYDPLSFRLTHLKSTRARSSDAKSKSVFRNTRVVQDLHFVYDPVGNLIRSSDRAFETVFTGGRKVEATNENTYDALYRLIEVHGREHSAQALLDAAPRRNRRDFPLLGNHSHPNDVHGLRAYTERFTYDAVGNIELLRHSAGADGWTRRYAYAEASLVQEDRRNNRLSRTTLGAGIRHEEQYTYDAHGNTTAMTGLPAMAWDYKDQLTTVELPGRRTAHYVYDATGQRLRTVITDGRARKRKERIYVGGYELYREFDGVRDSPMLARETLHVTDDKQRIALIETLTVDNGQAVAGSVLQRYQISNQLGSASVELDQKGRLVSYEEFHAFGTTAWQVGRKKREVNLKRYRFTGKERDEETGFNYHGARYYAPWIGRWISCDRPATKDYLSSDGPPYTYVQDRPTIAVDPDGAFIWFLAAAIVIAVVATPQIANAPAPGQRTYTRSTADLALNMAENAVAIYAAPRLIAGGAALIAEQGVVSGGLAILGRVGVGLAVAKTVQTAGDMVDPSGRLGRIMNLSLAMYALRPRAPAVPQEPLPQPQASTGPGAPPPPPSPGGPPAPAPLPPPPAPGVAPPAPAAATPAPPAPAPTSPAPATSGTPAPPTVVSTETVSPNPVRPADALQRWNDFLGRGPHTDIHPRTGVPDPNRIVSGDATRSIRMGPHEMNSSATKFHYHEETWRFDAGSNTWFVDNVVIRVPFPKGTW